METKNSIIQNYASSLMNMITMLGNNSQMLTDNIEYQEENKAIIATLNINIQSVKSQLTLLQNALDTYN